MSFPKLPLLLGVVGVTALASHAQNTTSPDSSLKTYTAVDAFGNLVRRPTPKVGISAPTEADLAAAQAVAGGATANASDRTRGGRDNRNDRIRGGTIYYGPAVPYYPYPYPAPGINNYYFPAQPSTTVIGRPNYAWEKPVTITSIPLGTTYYGGYPAPVYPGCPSYPAPAYGYGYPAPNYGYPAPVYGYSGYPGVPFPYGTTTYIYGSGNGSIYSQSQSGGYGVSLGNGGLSVQFGNRRSSSSTTVTGY